MPRHLTADAPPRPISAACPPGLRHLRLTLSAESRDRIPNAISTAVALAMRSDDSRNDLEIWAIRDRGLSGGGHEARPTFRGVPGPFRKNHGGYCKVWYPARLSIVSGQDARDLGERA
jgi:hypothetical protein